MYVVGWSTGPGTNTDYLAIKYQPSGDTAWVRTFNGTGNEVDGAINLSLDADGSVYVTGMSYSGYPATDDIVTFKYTPNGATVWKTTYNNQSNSSDLGMGIGLDAAGDIYVGGTSIGPEFGEWALVAIRYHEADCCLIRGDVDHSGVEPIDIADLVYLVDYMFNQGPPPPCWDDGDIDGSGIAPIDIADLVYLVDYMFNAGPPPPPCP